METPPPDIGLQADQDFNIIFQETDQLIRSCIEDAPESANDTGGAVSNLGCDRLEWVLI